MIDVTCAIIRNEDNDVLVVQRGEESDHPFRWEFPGGKTAVGESHEECIIREVNEELSMEIVICSQLEPVVHDYGNKIIRLIPFICDTLDELPVLSEHIAYNWVNPDRLSVVEFSEADIPVAMQYLNNMENTAKLHQDREGKGGEAIIDEDELQAMINSMMSTQEADWVAISALENPALFSKLLEYSYSENTKLAFRASWTLSKVCDKHPEIIIPHLPEIVETLPGIDNESVARSFLKILTISNLQNIPDRHHGLLAEYCFESLNSGESAIAIKAYSMEILYKLAIIYPELANELAASIRVLMEEGSAGIVARGNMILKKITEIPLNR